MAEVTGPGIPRVRYVAEWKGTITSLLEKDEGSRRHYRELAGKMSAILAAMEAAQAAPVLCDGKVGGNAAARIVLSGKEYLMLSKSGRLSGEDLKAEKDYCLLESFNHTTWQCSYYSSHPCILPTSDAPLHKAVFTACSRLPESSKPWVALHGHALAGEGEPERAGIPCSDVVTMASTPEDSKALIALMKEFPYPASDTYIRRDHGFFLLGKDMEEARKIFNNKIIPYI